MNEEIEGGATISGSVPELPGPFAVGRYSTALRSYMRQRARVQVLGEVAGLKLTAKSA